MRFYIFLPWYYLSCSSPLAVSFVVLLISTKIFTSKVYEFKKGDNVAEIVLHQDLPLCGDVRIEFYHHKRASQKVCTHMHACTAYLSTCMFSDLQEKMFQFWFNTFFVPWHMQYQAEEEKGTAVEVWMGNTLDKGNITGIHNGKKPCT